MRLGEGAMLRRLARVALLGWFALSVLLLGGLAAYRGQDEVAPAQPIAFPHTVHAGELGLECTFCHVNAPRSPRATVPPLSVCMTCHETIGLERPEVQKLRGYVERGESVVWRRVHAVPSFVHFTHKRHVRAGVDCAVCHGGVAKMARVKRVRPLTMGWCIACHWTRGAPTDCATCHV
jgi:hypothetical protein